jgi:uncharacterized membrane protein YraQ (UPF0718 family)
MSGTLDGALNNALQSMTPQQITSFTLANQASVIDSAQNGYANTFNTSFQNTVQAGQNWNLLTNYAVQTENLNKVVNDLEGQTQGNIYTAGSNLNTASRTREIQEWYYNNKVDTLFLFQVIFIGVCFVAVIATASKMGYIGSGVVGMLMGLVLVVVILVVINRAGYTDIQRDKRYWSKRIMATNGSLPGGLGAKCAT